jgi:DNA-binding beta-propeller fold protein YncE
MRQPIKTVAVVGLLVAVIAIAVRIMPLDAKSEVSLGGQGMATATVQSYAGKVRAPDFPEGLDWINTSEALTLNRLRGKVVLLDFWTYGCINCIHIIPDLKRLESEFPAELMVIGVHSAKFKNEGDTKNIREIVQRYEVEHPVVNDKDFAIWQAYTVQAWPTSMLIDPQGKVFGYYSGEGVYDALQPVIKGMIAEFDAQKMIDRTPIKIAPELAKRAESELSFPGKVLADPAGKRLFISDSNHNRIVIADLATYEVKAVIGTGTKGLKDGDFATAAFFRPQGLALTPDGNTLYVADTENHTIRAVNLKEKLVTTVAGTGKQSLGRGRGGAGLKTDLNSPWDLVCVNDILYIAMAGPHQLWAYDVNNTLVQPHAGSGREGIVDGPLADAQLAQPSGIASDGKVLYFADSEASAIRIADIDQSGGVRTIVGTGLFDFGDVDGVAETVRLQHALGVTVGPDGKLYVADTYNNKIKVIDRAKRESKTLFGKMEPGNRDGNDPLFYEPGGLHYADGKLYIADTNNNVIRVADLSSMQVSTVKFPNPEALKTPAKPETASGQATPEEEFFGDIVELKPITAAAGSGKITLSILLPEGYKFNDQAPFTMHVHQKGDVASVVNVAPGDNDLSIVLPKMPMTIPATLKAGKVTLTVDSDVFYCEAVNETLCFPASLRFVVPLTISADGGKPEIALEYMLVPPKVPKSTIGK